ncbi:MAG TPA: ornithine cyclodeaminase family protein [Amycolatopsis sp.]
MIGSLAGAPPMRDAIDALRAALLDGLDPEQDPPRSVAEGPHGQLLLMPAFWGRYAGVKVASVAPGNPALGLPRIQGGYLLLDGPTLSPLVLLDAVALTSVRTAAVSAVAADALAEPDAARLVVFGTGPQAHSHVEALRAVRPVRELIVVARDPGRTAEFVAGYPELAARAGTAADVAGADLVACCTTARTPLFDGSLLPDHTTVVAVGSHEPDAREVDDVTVRRSTVVVEARAAALREAGDVVLAVRSGAIRPDGLHTLSDLVRGKADVPAGRPRLFKSVGMAWEDLVVAATRHETARGDRR